MAKVIAKGYFDVVGASQDEGLTCLDPSLAVQAAKEETDINVIIKKYLLTGETPELRQGIYADVSELTDLAEALRQVQEAQEAFMMLPADVRRYFDNDPVKLVAFAQDPANLDKAIELGLAPRKPVSDPSPAGQAGTAGTEPAGAVKA